ncbi:hypothetical protein ACUSIJ_08650 [Pseudochelatococcus sp. B33]
MAPDEAAPLTAGNRQAIEARKAREVADVRSRAFEEARDGLRTFLETKRLQGGAPVQPRDVEP